MNWRRPNRIKAHVLLLAVFSVIRIQGASLEVTRLADLNPGTNGSFPRLWTAYGSALYFSAYTLSTGRELWKTSGQAPALLRDINDTADDIGFGVLEGNDSAPEWMTPLGGFLYFSAFDPRRGGELWRTDGTNTTRVTDINPDASDAIKPNPNSSWPNELVVLGSNLYFSATDNSAPMNYELWRFNGTNAAMVTNIHPQIGTNWSSHPKELTVFNGALYFMADDGANGFELWRHDGAATVLLTNLNAGGAESSSFPKSFTAWSNQLYFTAVSADTGYELWRTDGTNTVRLTDLAAGPESSFPDYLTIWNGALYFRATDGLNGYELWRFDGSQASLVTNLNSFADAFPKNLTVFQNRLFFAADDGMHGWELWEFDGSVASLVTNLNETGDFFPEKLTVAGDQLFFVGTSPSTGYELWSFDGTTAQLVLDLNPGPDSSFPIDVAAFDGDLYFSAVASGSSDWEPWVVRALDPPVAAPTLTVNAIGFDLRLDWLGTFGKTNQVQASTNLLGPYQNLGEMLVTAGGGTTNLQWIDFGAVTNQASKFYRVLVY